MYFSYIIILIVSLIVIAIMVNAVQQHRDKVEAEKRTEIAKQKSVIDETESVLMASSQIPVSKLVIFTLHQRIRNALQVMLELNPSMVDIKQRIRDTQSMMETIDIKEAPPSYDSFTLPDNDKMIIQYIQAIKKFRVLMRSEHNKGKVEARTYMAEDKRLEQLQLRVNVETLARRGLTALNGNMLGSARQYFEKAIAALDTQGDIDDYLLSRKRELQEKLQSIQDNLRNVNQADREKKIESEKNELDELFAPKKKW